MHDQSVAGRATLTCGDGSVATYAYDTASRLTGLTQDLAGAANDQTLSFASRPRARSSTQAMP